MNVCSVFRVVRWKFLSYNAPHSSVHCVLPHMKEYTKQEKTEFFLKERILQTFPSQIEKNAAPIGLNRPRFIKEMWWSRRTVKR